MLSVLDGVSGVFLAVCFFFGGGVGLSRLWRARAGGVNVVSGTCLCWLGK